MTHLFTIQKRSYIASQAEQTPRLFQPAHVVSWPSLCHCRVSAVVAGAADGADVSVSALHVCRDAEFLISLSLSRSHSHTHTLTQHYSPPTLMVSDCKSELLNITLHTEKSTQTFLQFFVNYSTISKAFHKKDKISIQYVKIIRKIIII